MKLLRAAVLTALALQLAPPCCGPLEAQAGIYVPPGWVQAGATTTDYQLRVDPQGGRGGSSGVRIDGTPGAEGFLGVLQRIDAARYRGRALRLAAWVRVEGVTGRAALFLRIDGRERRPVEFDNMRDRPIRGARGWERHEIVLPVPKEAVEIAFGGFLVGGGTAWVDDFSLEPVSAEPPGGTPSPSAGAASPPPSARSPEDELPGGPPGSGWLLGGSAPQDFRVELEPAGGRHGTAVASLRSTQDSTTGFVSLMRWIEAHAYRGGRLRLSAWIKPESVGGWAGLWMRVDGPEGRAGLAFDNMQARPIRGTSGWRRHEVVLDVPHDAERIYYGVLLDGQGRIEVDDFDLQPVGWEVPVTDQFAARAAPTNLDFDHPEAASGAGR